MRVCIVCNKEIFRDDKYARHTDFANRKKVAEAFFHRKCYNERVLAIKDKNEGSQEVINKASKMLDSLGIKLNLPKEDVIINLK